MKATGPRWWLRIWVAVVCLWLVAPTLVVVPLSFTSAKSFTFPPEGWSLRWYRNFFQNPDWSDAIINSLLIAGVVAVITTVLATAAALGLHGRRTFMAGVAHGAVLAPMVIPQIVIGIGVYGAFLDWQLTGTFLGFVLAHTALALPFAYVAIRASLSGYDPVLDRAAATLGARPLSSFLRVKLPLILPGVLTGAVFAFVTSLDEVIVALFIQSPTLRTLPVQMFSSVTVEVDPTIAAASTIVLTLTTAAILAPQLLRLKGKSPVESHL
jgi:putative spermidine/putrescine transport system permease protein